MSISKICCECGHVFYNLFEYYARGLTFCSRKCMKQFEERYEEDREHTLEDDYPIEVLYTHG